MPALTVHNAEIRTATVEVKMLTLAGKQVTLSVFRQLRERVLINEDGTLNGQPWGTVNYHPDKCADSPPHLHVVWQSGSDLFRDRVSLTVTFPRWIESNAATAWVDAKVREEATGTLVGWKPMPDDFTKTFLGVTVHMPMSQEAEMVNSLRGIVDDARRVVADRGPSHPVWPVAARHSRRAVATGLAAAREAARAGQVPATEELSAAEDLFEKSLAALPAASLVEAEAQLIAEVRAEADRRQRHRDARTALADLPQLFIAV